MQDIDKILREITEEEQKILDGKKGIDRSLYMRGRGNTVNSKKLLGAGKLITMRKHTRFIDFPEHTHDYVEVVYMYDGSTTHLVDGKKILLKKGELLFLGQSARHEILRSGENDIAINFIVLPPFFGETLTAFGDEETPLKHFIIDCLCGNKEGYNCLHYKVSGVTEIKNLIENLIMIVMGNAPNKRKLSQMTMALIFLQLLAFTERLVTETREDAAIFKLLNYIETNYADGSLTEAARELHYDISWLSREVVKKTGKTYTELVQEKRLSQAAFLLKNTNAKVSDISVSVGYENISYFHKLFSRCYSMSPRDYRINKQSAREDTF